MLWKLMDAIPSWVWALMLGLMSGMILIQGAKKAGLQVALAAQERATAEAVAETARVRAEIADELARHHAQRAEDERIARQRERELAEQVAEAGKQAKARIAELDRALGIALHSLRERPDRPEPAAPGGGVSEAAPACTGQTGPSLARPDAEFLVRYAADAERLSAALNQCEAAYEAARTR